MKKFNKKQIKILGGYFRIYEDEDTIELESWTDGGVDMFIHIDKNENIDHLEQFKDYIDSFDIDEEIDLHRQREDYKRAFSIRESVEDFDDYINNLKKIYEELLEEENDGIIF